MLSNFPQYILLTYILLFPVIIFFGLEPIKYVLFISLCMVSSICFLKKRKLVVWKCWTVLIIVSYLFIPLFLGIFNGFEKEVAQEGIAIFSFIAFVVVVFVLHDNGFINIIKIQNSISLMFYLYIFCEILLMLTYFQIGIPDFITDIMQKTYTRMRPETSVTGGFGGWLPRFNLPTDIFVSTLYLLYVKRNNGGNIFIWFVVLLFTILTFSRFRMASFLCISLLALSYSKFLVNLTLSKLIKIFVTLFIIYIMVLHFFIDLGIDFDTIYYVLDMRINGSDAVGSDMIREFQLEVLLQNILENPLLGIGLGGYDPICLRSYENKWMYELGYLMLTMQIGIVGLILSYFNFFVYFVRKTYINASKDMWITISVAYGMWFVEAGLQGALAVGSNLGLLVVCIYFLTAKIKNV